jgi:hypothetical protein
MKHFRWLSILKYLLLVLLIVVVTMILTFGPVKLR